MPVPANSLSRGLLNAITLFATLMSALVFAPVSFASSDSHLPTGIYALVNLNAETVSSSVLNNTSVTGLQIRAHWSKLQPSLGDTPNFVYFDNLIDIAKNKGKKVIIAVHRGLVGEGLPTGFPSSSLFTCGGKKGPKPWDDTYQQKWIALWQQLVDKYKLETAVTGYHIGGIYSWKTVDWDLCDSKSSDRQKWISAGYTIEGIRDFALDFALALSNATTKPFILPIAGTMDNAGVVDTGTNTRTYIMDPLFTCYGPNPQNFLNLCVAVADLLPRVGFMRTTFSDSTPDPEGIWNSEPLGDQFGTLYLYRPHIAGQRAVDPGALDAMFDISLHYDIQFMELGTLQITDAGTSLLTCYHDALVDGALDHCGH